ncbi:uncharacterized protein EI97DRAFT_433571 [Westerdykella ornata]|uniref:UBA domain-containing protein n=1 Tax=Westerdykella ornata TaxID=318751 RepID=A0A6A6JHX6_WESOR|nr:uncharacterized protein EI97DRAFT_433571 [Westerdykella ornata]KAF2276161.1 hypothetical protein EI97DRAFT_433571 [Westerdykella ornata]
MERVIQDSDDELEDEGLELPPTQVPHNTGASGGAGTGSTESLKKAFQDAHHAQFQTQFDESQTKIQATERVPTDISPSNPSPLKRLRTTSDASPTPRIQGNLTAYGRSKSSGDSAVVDPIHGQGEWARDGDPAQSVWGLEGTIRDDYTHHEPMALFPEPSSTILNTTLTEERLLAEVMAPSFLGLEPAHDPENTELRYEPKKSSIPWSDFLKTPSEHAQSRHDQESRPSQGSSQSRRASQKSFPEERSPAVSGTAADHPSQTAVSPSRTDGISPGLPADRTQGERANMPQLEETQSSKPHGPESSKKKYTKSLPPSTYDELEAIGLPQEQYKPRPSRSRSSRAALYESADYSVRPEAASKKRARRSRTTGALAETAALVTPEKVRQICEMGFTPQSTQRALEEHNGDVGQSINWLVAHNGDVDELALPNPPRIKRRRKNEAIDAKATEEKVQSSAGYNGSREEKGKDVLDALSQADLKTGADALLHLEASSSNVVDLPGRRSPAKVEVVIPPLAAPTIPASELEGSVAARKTARGEPNTAPAEGKREKPSSDMPRPDQDEQHQKVSGPEKQQRRARGRPKKNPVTATTAVEHTPTEENAPDEPALVAAEQKPLEQGAPPVSIPDDVVENSILDSIPPTSAAPVQSTKTPEKQAKPPDSARSPVSKGKVAYRVGLSKRARVAPLLKILKR